MPKRSTSEATALRSPRTDATRRLAPYTSDISASVNYETRKYIEVTARCLSHVTLGKICHFHTFKRFVFVHICRSVTRLRGLVHVHEATPPVSVHITNYPRVTLDP